MMAAIGLAIVDEKRRIAPVIRVFLRWNGESLGTDAARGIGGLDQAHCIGDGAGTASS